ncbi:hypothetical protein [Ensifer sp. Root278]|uniref:hypothetical protein n=1 Tax=Ensifer sp. Root278 TaxID=1736509 RepID=UPI000A94301A|nr:hypothetical protein [Ensifer sp. Root278]
MVDLHAFASKVLARLSEVYHRAPVAGQYRERLLVLALAQGGALHFLDRQTGLKDIDIWAFFKGGLDKPFPVRARWTADFGVSKFGKHPDDVSFAGRRIDILGRAVETKPNDDLIAPVSRWLNGHSSSAFELRKKAIIAIYPPGITGQRIN